MKDHFSPEAKSLLTQLLERDPLKRIGQFQSHQSSNFVEDQS
jgi:hypothetical protein